MGMKRNILLGSALMFLIMVNSLSSIAQTKEKRPNIVIILADDMGYSDMGMFGGEIKVSIRRTHI
jgi:arylsulfatase